MQLIIFYIYFFLIVLLIVQNAINFVISYSSILVSNENTLCYSFLPNHYYELNRELCNINCSYARSEKFPITNPFKCYNEQIYKESIYEFNKSNVYIFNTSTYGKYVKQQKYDTLEYEIQYIESNYFNTIILQFFPNRNRYSFSNRISVNVLLFDGLSRMAFNQQFKASHKFLISILKDYYIYDMLKYHTIGLNSRPNYVPLFYGIKYSNVTVRKKSLFNHFHDNGYTTISLSGFCDNNLKHYGNPEEYGADHNINIACHPSINNYNKTGAYGTGPRCIYGKRVSYMFIDYLKEALSYYTLSNISTFSYISFSETHDANQLSAAGIDSKLKEYFKNKVLNRVITLIAGDHGIHYGKYCNEIENTFPPLIIIINKKLITTKIHHILSTNQNRLITPYNIFYSLLYISNGFNGDIEKTVFRIIPSKKNCKNSKIESKCNCI